MVCKFCTPFTSLHRYQQIDDNTGFKLLKYNVLGRHFTKRRFDNKIENRTELAVRYCLIS